MALADQISNRIAMQAVVTQQPEITGLSVPLRIALFNDDGTPFSFGDGSGTPSPVTFPQTDFLGAVNDILEG